MAGVGGLFNSLHSRVFRFSLESIKVQDCSVRGGLVLRV